MQFSPAGRDDLCSGRNHPSFPTIKQLRHNNPALNKLQAAAKSPKKNPPEKQQLPKTELGRSRVGATCFPRPQTSKACDHSELLQQLGWAGAGFRIGIWGCAVPQGLCSPRSVEKLGGIKRMQTLTEWCSQEQHLIP